MELDELKNLWQQADRRLATMEPALRLNLRLARAGTLDRTRSRLRFVHFVLWFEVGISALAVLLLGSYLYDHLGTARFALPAAVLHLGAIATLGLAVRQLVALGQVDYAGPVVSIQRRLAELGAVRARANRWLLLSAPLLWALLIVVVPHALVGVDVYLSFGLLWVGGNFFFGIAILGGAAWFSRRLPAASRGSAFLRWLGDDLTGQRVAAASGFLDQIVNFEAEG